MSTQGRETSRRIVIVGGGVSGLSIAVRLSQSGFSVTVLEASRLGHGGSSRNQGWLYSGAWFAPRQKQLARMCLGSLERTIRYCPDCLEPGAASMLYIVSSPRTIPSDWTKAWETAGIPYQPVATSRAIDETGIAEALVHHAFTLPDRAIRTNILLEQLAAQAEHQGTEIRTHCLVTALSTSGSQVDGVITSTGEEISARLVILATNAATFRLLPDAPVPGMQSEFTRVALKTHCMAIFPGLTAAPYCVLDLDGFNHLPHGGTSVFGTSRWIPVSEADDQRVMPPECNRLRDHVACLYPSGGHESRNRVEWAGINVEAMHVDQVEPGLAPMPTVIDHEYEAPHFSSLLSVFPGRASLWSELAEATRLAVLEKLHDGTPATERPPWAIDEAKNCA